MSILARFAGLFPRRGASDTPDRSPLLLDASARISGPVPRTGRTQSADGLALLKARRMVLLTEARRLRDLRRSKDASTCEAELRAITTELLAAEIGKNFPEVAP